MAKNRSPGNRRTLAKRFREQGGNNSSSETPVYVKKAPVEYGKPFIVMEDTEKNTFAYDGMAWNPYHLSIAECKVDCLVKALPQKLNGKTRYEVRAPLNRA